MDAGKKKGMQLVFRVRMCENEMLCKRSLFGKLQRRYFFTQKETYHVSDL
jgi:hypothetical protein